VLVTLVKSGDYFFFAVSDGSATAFRSEIGQKDLAGLEWQVKGDSHQIWRISSGQRRAAKPQPRGLAPKIRRT
jgi:hypothetical protein